MKLLQSSSLFILPLLGSCHAFVSSREVTPPSTIQLRPEVVKTILPPFGPNSRGRTGSPVRKSFSELQLNLCNSGIARCYQNGTSIPEGGELIYGLGPNLVTVNEICMKDVTTQLQRYLAEAWPEDYTYSAFMPAIDKRTSTGYRCKNGDFYGSAVIGRVPAAQWVGVDVWGGLYTSQDGGNEQRTFACANAVGDHFACTTHLSARTKAVALEQCKALMFDALPYLQGLGDIQGKTVVGGDFNLKYNTSIAENVQNCVPERYIRKDDGDVQHVVFSDDYKFRGTQELVLGSTDHPALEVKLKGSE